GRYRVVRRPARDISAVHLDASGVGLHQPAEYAHESGLASAVLSYEGVDFPGEDFERCTAVCLDSPERLLDPFHSDSFAHSELGTLIRPAMISCLSSSTLARTLSG